MVGLTVFEGCLVFILCGIAGLIQGSAGIGFSMFVMSFAPMLMPYALAVNVNRFVGLTVAAVGLWQYRHGIRLHKILPPALAGLLTSLIGIRVFQIADEALLKRALGIFLIAMVFISLTLQHRKIKLRANWVTGALIGALAGVASGLFNVLGPILAVYYMAVSDSTEEYRCSLNLTFVIQFLWINLVYQTVTGYTGAEWVCGLIGTVASAAGLLISARWAGKINKEKVSWLMYGIILIMAVCMLLT